MSMWARRIGNSSSNKKSTAKESGIGSRLGKLAQGFKGGKSSNATDTDATVKSSANNKGGGGKFSIFGRRGGNQAAIATTRVMTEANHASSKKKKDAQESEPAQLLDVDNDVQQNQPPESLAGITSKPELIRSADKANATADASSSHHTNNVTEESTNVQHAPARSSSIQDITVEQVIANLNSLKGTSTTEVLNDLPIRRGTFVGGN